ncbi:hypothetical protein Ae201684_008753 [Aphanomyces euteiches]|uniref:Uncharacterized protein n=1 Tax=Aphanomyces euteiches TaxID=100861 RepID=A0A6G0X441_9STRA|nr:hypothetical protein Ae201684_008753 [Aphanomyces euteiches]
MLRGKRRGVPCHGDTINAFVAPVNFDEVHKAAWNFLWLAFALFATGYGSFTCFAITAERQMKKMRCECLKHIMYQDMGWYDQRDMSELASRISGDTVKIKEGLGDKLGEALGYFCQFLSGYIIGFSKGWNLSLVMACVMPLMSVSIGFLMKRMRESTARSQKAYAGAGAVAEETIGAMRTVASLNGESRAMAKYPANVAEAETVTIGVSKFVALAFGWVFFLMWLTYAFGLWYGGWLVSKQNQIIPDPRTVLSVFYGILLGTLAVGQIGPNVNAMSSAKGAATALFNILARKSDIDASDMSGEIPPTCEGNIQARDVHFTYPSRPEDPILRGYSLTIKKGETVAFVGASGSGKSTLVALLERFYQPTSGAIYLDGRDISTLQLKWLRSQIGLVSQEPVLFAATIFENIAPGGDNISRDQVIAAAKLANAHDFIMGLPDGYDTMCGEKGATLSGGQKQRVAIARALVRQPKILVLDEATSALDNESERVVQDAINNLMTHTDMTTIVIAHRLSTIRSADQIAVISKGVVAELGRHDELMRLENGFYRSLIELQANAPTVKDGHRPVEEYKRHVLMASEDGHGKALSDRKSSSASQASVGKSIEYVGTVEKEVKLGRIFELTKPQRLFFVLGVIASCLLGFSMPGISLIISKIISDMNLHFAAFVNSGTKDLTPLSTLYDSVANSSYIFFGIAVAILVASFVQTYTFRVIAEKRSQWRWKDITLDGRDISTLNLHWLRSQIGLVGQEPVLFVGTIAENIASGLSDSVPSTDLQERVEEAAKMANAHNFIMQFPDGYQTQVGLKGEQLSGGQKQRIAIARAIMKNPSILLLDEATSALDSESEKVVQEALDKLLAAKGRTTIVIAHRLSTIRNADKICVVSGGRIAEQGTHDELLRLNGIYTRLVLTNKKIG